MDLLHRVIVLVAFTTTMISIASILYLLGKKYQNRFVRLFFIYFILSNSFDYVLLVLGFLRSVMDGPYNYFIILRVLGVLWVPVFYISVYYWLLFVQNIFRVEKSRTINNFYFGLTVTMTLFIYAVSAFPSLIDIPQVFSILDNIHYVIQIFMVLVCLYHFRFLKKLPLKVERNYIRFTPVLYILFNIIWLLNATGIIFRGIDSSLYLVIIGVSTDFTQTVVLYLFLKRHHHTIQIHYSSYERELANYSLTKREKEITLLLKSGISNQAIADKLFISISTVEKHINKAYKKLNVKNKVELVKKLLDSDNKT